jgi:hypothetical protein
VLCRGKFGKSIISGHSGLRLPRKTEVSLMKKTVEDKDLALIVAAAVLVIALARF